MKKLTLKTDTTKGEKVTAIAVQCWG